MAILANPPRGPLFRNVLGAGRYIPPEGLATSASTVAISANLLYCFPFNVNVNADALVLAVTAGSAGAARMGLYACDSRSGEPTTLLEEGSVLDVTGTGTMASTFAAARYLNSSLWIVMVASSTPTLASCASTQSSQQAVLGVASLTSAATPCGFTTPFTYAALPTAFPATAKTLISTPANVPALAVRTA